MVNGLLWIVFLAVLAVAIVSASPFFALIGAVIVTVGLATL